MTTLLTAVLLLQQASSPPSSELHWTFKSVGTEETPRSEVWLQKGEKKARIKTVTGNPDIIATFADHDWIPKTAVAACSNWWAGQGDQFYVTRKGKAFRVYHRQLQEESSPGRFHLVKTVKL